MAKAGFGGGGDYSGVFAGLYSANRDSQRAQQDASDQDAADKWNNGLMSDDEWLSYIKTRIDAEASSPKRQEHWVTYLRKYSVVIADNQAEFAYKNGGTINQLVAYYEGRLGHLDKNSTEYRDLQLRVNDLYDTRASNSIQDGAKSIIDGINKGSKTYGDLQAFLSAKVKESRPNSDLRKSLEKQIKDVGEQIRTNHLEGDFERLQYQYDAGKLSGGAYASQLRKMAVQFKDNDPKRYYQILEAAVALSKGAARHASATGRAARNKQLNASVDAIQAQRNHTQALIEQFDNLGLGKTGVDPVTGKPVVFNEAKIKELDRSLLKTYDKLAGAYHAKGDLSAEANVQKAKAGYVSQNILAHNTMAADDTTRELMVSTNKILDSAMADPDPTRAMATLRGLAKNWDTYGKSLELNAHKATATTGLRGPLRGENDPGGNTYYDGKKGLLDQVMGDRVDRAKTMSAALATITKPGVTDEEVMAATQAIGMYDNGSAGPGESKGAYSGIVKGVTQIAAREQGIATGELSRIVSDGKLDYVRTHAVTTYTVGPGGAMVPVTKNVPDIDGIDGQNRKMVDIFIDINGTPTKVAAVAERTGVEGYNTWASSTTLKIGKGSKAISIEAGRPITDAEIDTLKRAGQWDEYLTTGKVQQAPALDLYQVRTAGFTDKNGAYHAPQTWVQDTDTQLWFQDALPLRGAQRREDGTIRYGETDGKRSALIDWQAYASAKGVAAPYAGQDPKAMQDLFNTGQVAVSGVRGRDATGKLTDTAAGLQNSYYDPTLAPTPPGARDNWWADEERERRAQSLLDIDRSRVQSAKARMDARMKANMDPEEYDAYKKGKLGDAGDAARGFLETSGINALARSLGINIDGAKDKEPAFKPLSGKEKDDFYTPLGTGNASGKKKAGAAPVVTLPKPAANQYTGPAVKADVSLDLPATKAAPLKIRVKDDEGLLDRSAKPPKTAPIVKAPPVPLIGSTNPSNSNQNKGHRQL